MKGIILAGGLGTRMSMTRYNLNKHLVRAYDFPMIYHPIDTLKRSGFERILIVTEASIKDRFEEIVGDGGEWGVKLQYVAQTGAGGIAAALGATKNFANGDSVAVILGDNLFEYDFKKAVDSFRSGATIFLKRFRNKKNLQSFGVPVFHGSQIMSIEEKPQSPQSDYAVTGFYLFDGDFFKKISNLKRSPRGELEITDLVNEYRKEGRLHYEKVGGHWADMGTAPSLHAAANWIKRRQKNNA